MTKFLLYLTRWQLSTPILWFIIFLLGPGLWPTIIANLVGGAIFFFVDRLIFRSNLIELWHISENGNCSVCGTLGYSYRLIKTKGYDRTTAEPKFLCADCSMKKVMQNNLKVKGVYYG